MTNYFIYILNNASNMLYVGLTTDIEKMLNKHRKKDVASFKGNFAFETLIYVEETCDIEYAIKRERELKESPSYLKMDLLKLTNPSLECLSLFFESNAVSELNSSFT